jgi:hypothetical protein
MWMPFDHCGVTIGPSGGLVTVDMFVLLMPLPCTTAPGRMATGCSSAAHPVPQLLLRWVGAIV